MTHDVLSRRQFIGLSAMTAVGMLVDCREQSGPRPSDGILTARPGPPQLNATTGLQPLQLSRGRDGLLYVPTTYDAAAPGPFLVLLHGAGQSADFWTTEAFLALLEARNIVTLMPDSRGATWDLAYGGFDGDVAFIDAAMAFAFNRVVVDSARLAIGGFSDGASYGLSLGVTNGDLFTRLLGFSPGYFAPSRREGRPKVFLSHGTSDPILPIGFTRDQLAPSLRIAGYEVTFVEFSGGHQVTSGVATQAMDWIAAP